MPRTPLTLIAATVSAALLAGQAAPAAAQPAPRAPSWLQQGAAAAMYGRCQTDVLSAGPGLRAAAALGALAPAAASRIAPSPDPLGFLVQACGARRTSTARR